MLPMRSVHSLNIKRGFQVDKLTTVGFSVGGHSLLRWSHRYGDGIEPLTGTKRNRNVSFWHRRWRVHARQKFQWII